MTPLLRSSVLAYATCSLIAAFAAPYVQEVALTPGAETSQSLVAKAANLVPSPRQLAYHKLEYIAFVHFGPNTFTGAEWGSGRESAAVFNPGDTLDTDQWCRVAKAAGMRLVLLTVKHHDGFCLWQTRYNDRFSVRGIPWRAGKGDVLRELSDSCRKHGLKLGVYLSPADLYQMESAQGLYGNGSKSQASVIPTDPASFLSAPERMRAGLAPGAPSFRVEADDYNRYFMNQLYELLTEYGPIHEVWFDGAHPKSKGGQKYIKAKWFELIRALAPDAVIFGGPDVRWCGNEAGRTRDAEWNALPVQSLVEAGKDRVDEDLGSLPKLSLGSYKVYGEKLVSNKLCYLVPEINTSIRTGWFWRNEHEQGVRTADDIFDIYERAVGGNGVFLLNLPPDKSGRIAPRDVASLEDSGRRIRATYGDRALMAGASAPSPALLDDDPATYWQPAGETGECVVTLGAPRAVNRVVLQEAIGVVGQRVASHALDAFVDGAWREVARAKTIGYKRILRFPEVTTDRFRVRILESRLSPALAEFSAHHYEAPVPALQVRRSAEGRVVMAPAVASFAWKAHGQGDDSVRGALVIRYTLDGSEPGPGSPEYRGPTELPEGGRVRARAFLGERAGPVVEARIALASAGWRVVSATGGAASAKNEPRAAIDGAAHTFWLTGGSAPHPHALEVDMGKVTPVVGFTYLPRQDKLVAAGMVERGEVAFSEDGKAWSVPVAFEFGNLVNDPSVRTVLFSGPPLRARYFRFISKAGAAGSPQAGAAEIGILAR